MEEVSVPIQDWHELAPFIATAEVPIVLQFATSACVLCPDASRRINELMKTHHFSWHHMDATISELAVELEVTKLPAIAIIHSAGQYRLYQQLRGDDVNKAIDAECERRLVLDEDF